jgi:drug/metabolite transporter (DMT)-like permease
VKPLVLALLSAALFGAATPASRALLAEVSPFQLAGLLYLGAALGVAPFAWRHGRFRLPGTDDRRNRMRLLGAVVAGGIAGPVLLLFGLRLAGAASVSLWLTLELVATALLGALFFRESLGRLGWIGVTAAIAAAAVLAGLDPQAGILACLLVGAACLCWGARPLMKLSFESQLRRSCTSAWIRPQIPATPPKPSEPILKKTQKVSASLCVFMRRRPAR